jgi:minichromosome maintenance protein 10
MAEGRAAEKARLERAERVQANRSSAFQLDKAEVDAFKTAAANRMPSPPSSSIREPEAPSYSREDIMRALNKPRPDGLTRSETAPNVRRNGKPSEEAGDSSKFESYSRQHLSSRVLPHSFLSRTLAEKKVLCIPDLLKTVKAPDFELPDEIDGDFVVFGIVASKSDPKQKQNAGNASAKTVDPYDDGLNNTDRYMVITLTDLKWSIDLFLFDTAFPRYYKVSEGTLIAILNPTIMPPPKHKLDTNRFSLALSSSDDKVLEIGHSRDIGYCKATRKDGKTCQTWVDGRKTEFCDFHVDLQIRRTQGQRMGVNSDTGMFGPGGKSGSRTGFFGEGGKRRSGQRDPNAPKQGLKPEGAQYDWGSQSTYYVAPSRKNDGNRSSYHPNASGESAANLLDSVSDDPFIAAGMMGRGMENKEERLRRRLATQQREREITEKLVAGRTGVGADYLRSRTANESPAAGNKDKLSGTSSSPKTLPQSSSMNLASFGKAKSVRLSPMKRANANPHGSGVKKTRFITANGIREAGRESLGGPAETGTSRRQVLSDDDDDDELDII